MSKKQETTYETFIASVILFIGVLFIAGALYLLTLIFPELNNSESDTTTHSYSRTRAIENILRSNNPDISDDKIKAGAKYIEKEWNKATK